MVSSGIDINNKFNVISNFTVIVPDNFQCVNTFQVGSHTTQLPHPLLFHYMQFIAHATLNLLLCGTTL